MSVIAAPLSTRKFTLTPFTFPSTRYPPVQIAEIGFCKTNCFLPVLSVCWGCDVVYDDDSDTMDDARDPDAAMADTGDFDGDFDGNIWRCVPFFHTDSK